MTADRLREQHLGGRVYPGPVDTAIYSIDDGHCIADRMASEGVTWTPAPRMPAAGKTAGSFSVSGSRTR